MTQPPLDEHHTRLLLRLADQRALVAALPSPDGWLTATERVRWEAFHTEPRRLSFLAGRWLARETVARWCGSSTLPPLDVVPSGACVVADGSGIFVSISHHADAVACAVAAVPVGVDIESPRRRRDVLALSGMVDSQAQQAALAHRPEAERDQQFLQHWTLKEAWLKARQQGLDFALMRSLEFDDACERAYGGMNGVDGAGGAGCPGGTDGPGGRDAADTAVAHHGELIIALAGVPSLPKELDAPPGIIWRRYRSRHVAG